MKRLVTPTNLQVFSQVFSNLAAGWFGVVVILPGITRLASLNDIFWLIKNILFGIVALWLALILAKKAAEMEKYA